MVNFQEIKDCLPDATDEQVKRFVQSVERLTRFQNFLKKYPDENQRFGEQIKKATKALQYRQPYRIAVIGITGAGKSTLINALLGRELLLTKALDKPATGAALYIFFDVPPDGEEKAVVEHRQEADIRLLLSQFFERYRLQSSSISGALDSNYVRALQRLEPKIDLDELGLKKFQELRDTLADIVNQFGSFKPSNSKREYSLSDSEYIKELMRLVDENSELNALGSPFRQIGLIKSVTYHIQPQLTTDEQGALKIPKNVCLVDLPGLDGSSFHDLIITEGIKDADAVIFIQRPPRLLSGGDTFLLESIRKYIGLEGSVESGEKIFIVLNAKDSIMADQVPENLPKNMQELIEKIVPGYITHPYLSKRGGDTPYFLTSAWAALQAQKMLHNQKVDDTGKFRSVSLDLGVDNGDPAAVLKASQIPKLVEELTQFARDRRIQGQLREGNLALDQIFNSLDNEYKNQLRQSPEITPAYEKKQRQNALKEEQKKAFKKVTDFRIALEGRFQDLKADLQGQARTICDTTDKLLQQEMPRIWQDKTNSDIDFLTGELVAAILPTFYSEVEILLWKQLALLLPQLGNRLVQFYDEALGSSRILLEISQSSCNTVSQETLQAEVQAWINKEQGMRAMLGAIASRLPLTIMVDPDKYLSNEIKVKIDIRPEETPQPRQFQPLSEALRKYYQDFILNDGIEGLLNLYRYEMIVIQDLLIKRLSEIFHDLGESNDPQIQEQILAKYPDSKADQVRLLKHKLADLQVAQEGAKEA
jgi:hypothetical protein